MMTAEEKAAFLSARCGFLTASRMKDAMDFNTKGQPNKARTQYMYDILAERMTGNSVRHFVTDAMQRGLDYEDEMFDVFVEMTGRDIKRSHFYEHPTISYCGATPDREIDADGLLEGKIPSLSRFIEWKLAGVVPKEHEPQLLLQLACTGKKWTGFVAFAPEMKEERHRLFLAKFAPEPAAIEIVEGFAKQFLDEVETLWERLTTA